jgi:hypothetical protein
MPNAEAPRPKSTSVSTVHDAPEGVHRMALLDAPVAKPTITPAEVIPREYAPVAPAGSGSTEGGAVGVAQVTTLTTPAIMHPAVAWPVLLRMVWTQCVAPAGCASICQPAAGVQTAAALPALIQPEELTDHGPGSMPPGKGGSCSATYPAGPGFQRTDRVLLVPT